MTRARVPQSVAMDEKFEQAKESTDDGPSEPNHAPLPDQDRASHLGGRRGLAGKLAAGPGGSESDADRNELSSRKHRFMTALLDKLSFDPGLQETSAKETSPSVLTSAKMNYTYAPGSTPLPRYTIRRGIGIGGFGEVYFAVSEAGKEVALKRIQRNLDIELRGVTHCLNLKHPNLVALYDVCRDSNDQAWVVMEYVAGPNLRHVLDDAPDGLPESEVRRWFTSIAAGVGHLHSAGLVHRDLKPGNVFDDLGIIKVGDYGLSKFISASHRGGHTESVGTFHYMAPEIGRGEYGREIDIYALGVLLYELMTGRVPFDGESCHEIIVKHLTATPDLTGIAQPYRTAIERALAKDPGRRPRHVGELLNLLGISEPGLSGFVAPVAPQADRDQPRPGELNGRNFQPSPASPSPQPQPRHSGAREPLDSRARGEAATHNRSYDEPLARAIRHSLADLGRWWRTLDRSPGAKAFLAVVAVVVLLFNTHWLLALLSLVAIFYVPYYVVRHMVLHVRQQPSYAEAQRIATAHGVKPRPISRTQWRRHMRTELRAKHSVHRLAELTTSWTASTFTVVGMMIVASIIGLRSSEVDPLTLAPYAWMGSIVLVASLALLGMGKLWERDEGEALPRRMVLAGIGAAIGAFAVASQGFLMLPTDTGVIREIEATTLPAALYRDGQIPLSGAYIAHFALLFAALRWWKPVDPLRRTRLSLWTVAVVVVGEWMLHQILPIPQPQGMLIAGGLAIAIQMSAPWTNPREAMPKSLYTDEQFSRRVA